jgi:ABC-type nitrate/sulfonate/bicarbonate transport system substrate-binding protein
MTLAVALLAMAVILAVGVAHAAPFRIAHHRSVMGAVTVVAHKMGYFNETIGKGKYTIKQFAQGKLIRQAILSNSVDVGGAADRAFYSAISKRARTTGIANANYWCKANRLLVRPDSKIKSVAGLKGKKLGVGKATGTYFTFTNFVLPAYKMTEKDFTPVNMNNDTRIAALKSRTVDMIALNNPQAAIAEEKGIARSIETFCKYANNLWIILANGKTLKSKRGDYVKFLRGFIRGMKLHQTDREKFARVYHKHLQSKGAKMSFNVVKKSVNDLEFRLMPSEKDYKWFDFMGKVLMKKKKAKRTVDLRKEGMDLSMVKEAMKAEGWKDMN